MPASLTFVLSLFPPSIMQLSVVYNDHSIFVWDLSNMRQIGVLHSFLFHSAGVWDICVRVPNLTSYCTDYHHGSMRVCMILYLILIFMLFIVPNLKLEVLEHIFCSFFNVASMQISTCTQYAYRSPIKINVGPFCM